MSEELKREQDIRYLYENALAQIVSIVETLKEERMPSRDLVPRIYRIANSALMHDFKAIYPSHTEEFHEEIRKRHA